ncbi:MAG: 4-alpha-glucanotransferase [Clostridia bacterium]|nr:4-alpha-glucanotransferase [Clostridia bacterium]
MRLSGILLPISALPSRWGIGAFDRCAYEFADKLAAAGQGVWQILPLGPTGYADSPYQAFSAYAGNPYFISLDALIERGLLRESEAAALGWGDDPRRVDYGLLYQNRLQLLRTAHSRADARLLDAVAAFTRANAGWLPDYALYMAVKSASGMRPWNEWADEDIKLRRHGAVERCREAFADETAFHCFVQYLFFEQWAALKRYVNSRGILIVGDLPIYVSLDSSDVWAHRELFQLDRDGTPTRVAGVPPDYFTADGQLWGNPLYRYDVMERDGYSWWLDRLRACAERYDVTRFDHFRGLDSYWSVPYGETTARGGEWVTGPGKGFVDAIRRALPHMRIIAEDLGYLTDSVRELLDYSGFPGMKVLQFAFDGSGSGADNAYLPHMYDSNCVCYTGTHDNVPVRAFPAHAAQDALSFAAAYLDCQPSEIPGKLLRAGMASVAELFVAQMQDYLMLGEEARMNAPATSEGNWVWRMAPDDFSDELVGRIAELTELYGRRRPS